MMMKGMRSSSSSSSKRRTRRLLILGINIFLLVIFVYRNIITANTKIKQETTISTTTTNSATRYDDIIEVESSNNIDDDRNVTTTEPRIILPENNKQQQQQQQRQKQQKGDSTPINIVNNIAMIQNSTSQDKNNNSQSTNNLNSWRPTKDWIDECVSEEQSLTENNRPFDVKWRRYTLGDCFRFCRNCYHKDCVDNPSKTYQKSSGCYEKTSRNDTFAALYYFQSCFGHIKQDNKKLLVNGNYSRDIEGSKNWTILHQIIINESKHQYKIPDDNEIVIHLRLGDVIEKSPEPDVSRMLLYGADPRHHEKSSIKPISEYLDNIEEILTSFIDDNNNSSRMLPPPPPAVAALNVTIRGGSHDPKYYKKGRIYANCLQKAIQTYILPTTTTGQQQVTMNIEGLTPDEDFYYMAHSKHLILSSGGYSNMIGDYSQKYNDGTIYGRTFREKYT